MSSQGGGTHSEDSKEGVLMVVSSDSSYTQIGFKLTSVQVWKTYGDDEDLKCRELGIFDILFRVILKETSRADDADASSMLTRLHLSK